MMVESFCHVSCSSNSANILWMIYGDLLSEKSEVRDL